MAGVVLAAGRSRRMGTSKPLLDLGGRSFLRASVEALREGGCGRVVAVVAAPDAGDEARAAGAEVVEGQPDGEQVDSLRAGLDALDRADRSGDGAAPDAAVVLPVDHPLVRPDTVRALLAAASADPDALIRPIYHGRPGHPTVFPRAVWPALRDPTLPHGARSVVESSGTRTVDVEVEDPGVVADIDTPGAYQRHVGGVP